MSTNCHYIVCFLSNENELYNEKIVVLRGKEIILIVTNYRVAWYSLDPTLSHYVTLRGSDQ